MLNVFQPIKILFLFNVIKKNLFLAVRKIIYNRTPNVSNGIEGSL